MHLRNTDKSKGRKKHDFYMHINIQVNNRDTIKHKKSEYQEIKK